MITYYLLDDDGEPVPTTDVMRWAVWFEQSADQRVLKQDYVEGERHTVEIFGRAHHGGVGVSTVFLGLDHNHRATGPPILWESMVFGTSLDGTQRRYASREEALAGHARLVEDVRAAYEQEQR